MLTFNESKENFRIVFWCFSAIKTLLHHHLILISQFLLRNSYICFFLVNLCRWIDNNFDDMSNLTGLRFFNHHFLIFQQVFYMLLVWFLFAQKIGCWIGGLAARLVSTSGLLNISDIIQFFDHDIWSSILQLLKDKSKDPYKLLKYFNGTTASVSNISLSVGMLPIIFVSCSKIYLSLSCYYLFCNYLTDYTLT